MRGFGNGFLWGLVTGIAGLFVLAYVANDAADLTCKRQGWVGEACQCRKLQNDEPKP